MPAKSERRAAGAALAAKRSGAKGKGASAKMARSMSTAQLRKYASKPTKRY